MKILITEEQLKKVVGTLPDNESLMNLVGDLHNRMKLTDEVNKEIIDKYEELLLFLKYVTNRLSN